MTKNIISLEEAQKWAKLYREEYKDQPIAYSIPRVNFDQLFSKKEVYDVRVYMGLNPETKLPQLMLVGMDKDGNDLIDEKNEFYIYDFSKLCPDHCDGTSPLNKL